MRLLLLSVLAACAPVPADDLVPSDPIERDTDEPSLPGDTGDTGDSGDTGDTGDSGDSGDTGDSGDSGNSGDTGDTGTTEPDCPAGMVCPDAFPFVDSADTTRDGVRGFDRYACAPSTNESGPEVTYRVILDEPGFLAASLSGLPSGVDIDVHVLASDDAGDCIDRGHWNAGAYLEAGTYYVVADTWVNASGVEKGGRYTLTLGFTGITSLEADGLDREALSASLYAFDTAWNEGDTERFEYAIIDFEAPSTHERLYVLDLATNDVLFQTYVSHGINSNHPTDPRLAVTFSNVPDSLQSSLGMIEAAEVYTGEYGRSMRLDGLDSQFNSKVRPRAIVMHPADYSTGEFARAYGYLGRSWGCPSIPPALSDDIIDTLTGGALLFAWYPDPTFYADSDYLAGWAAP